MRFKIDENLPQKIVHIAIAAGHDAICVRDEGLSGASDTLIAQAIRDESRVLVTLDLDFADIRRYVPADYPGLIVLRLAREDHDYVGTIFQRILEALRGSTPMGKLWVVDEAGIRIRG